MGDVSKRRSAIQYEYEEKDVSVIRPGETRTEKSKKRSLTVPRQFIYVFFMICAGFLFAYDAANAGVISDFIDALLTSISGWDIRGAVIDFFSDWAIRKTM